MKYFTLIIGFLFAINLNGQTAKHIKVTNVDGKLHIEKAVDINAGKITTEVFIADDLAHAIELMEAEEVRHLEAYQLDSLNAERLWQRIQHLNNKRTEYIQSGNFNTNMAAKIRVKIDNNQ